MRIDGGHAMNQVDGELLEVNAYSQHGVGESVSRQPSIIIEPRKGALDLGLEELWRHHEFLYFIVWRELKVRYKQTAIGVSWVILQPVLTVAVFSLIFASFVRMPSAGVPYPALVFAALLPWNYFSRAVTLSTTSLVADSALVRKVYFPRLALTIAATIVPLADPAVAYVVFQVLLAAYGVMPTWSLVFLPLFLFMAAAASLGVGLWLAPLNVLYRDVGHAIPFAVQLWMFASPVVYPADLIPAKWQILYHLNPIVGVIEGFRWALLGTPLPAAGSLGIGVGVTIVVLVSGLFFFRRAEQSFADLI